MLVWATAGWLAPSAEACVIITPGHFQYALDSEDDVSPTFGAADLSYTVSRGVGPVCHDGGGVSVTSCDDLGTISLSFDAAWDDQAPEYLDDGSLQVQRGMCHRRGGQAGAVALRPGGVGDAPRQNHSNPTGRHR